MSGECSYPVRMSNQDFAGNIERFTGFADHYDDHRPTPPAILAELLTRLLRGGRPSLVVDLGCGTGLSTRYWADKAAQVIGIEPTVAMRAQAEKHPAANVSYREGFSHTTGLDARCAQIVTASQSLHWMEPEGTFREVARVLEAGGVFAAYDYDWPPVTGVWQVDQAYGACMNTIRALEKTHGVDRLVRRWDKAGHLKRMQESGCFRYAREVVLHHRDRGNASRLLGLILSQGSARSLLKMGLSEEELGLDRLREVVTAHLDSQDREWIWSSRVRLGIV